MIFFLHDDFVDIYFFFEGGGGGSFQNGTGFMGHLYSC